jgi:hypothetical protein
MKTDPTNKVGFFYFSINYYACIIFIDLLCMHSNFYYIWSQFLKDERQNHRLCSENHVVGRK